MDAYVTRIPFRRGAAEHTVAVVYDRPTRFRAEMTVSPTGRSVQLHINGEKVWPNGPGDR